MHYDTAFQISASAIRFGPGTTREVGLDLKALGARRVLVVQDPALATLPTGDAVREALRAARLDHDVFDEVSVEPTDASFQRAAEVARSGQFDAFLAVGGGSTIDTAKAANLYSTHPADFLEYVNAPVGAGRPVPGPLRPLIAVPTTAGTGSETTGVAIFDFVSRRLKTGISHPYLKPTLGIIDPENTRTLPAAVAAAAGLDVLSHALESYTARPYHQRPRPENPSQRPTYQGANPISDIWALRALEMVRDYLPRAVADADDLEARGQMLLAASMAGIGFGSAGVHLPHAMAYPVAGMVRDFKPAGYDVDHPMVPHGISVILHTPAVARFTAPVSPQRHLRAAAALGADLSGTDFSGTDFSSGDFSSGDFSSGDFSSGGAQDVGQVLSGQVLQFIRQLEMPNGLAALGYTENDIPALVEGTLAQARLTCLSPREADAETLARLFHESLRL